MITTLSVHPFVGGLRVLIPFFGPLECLDLGRSKQWAPPLGNRHQSHMNYRGGMDTGNLDLGGFPPCASVRTPKSGACAGGLELPSVRADGLIPSVCIHRAGCHLPNGNQGGWSRAVATGDPTLRVMSKLSNRARMAHPRVQWLPAP